MKGLTLCSLAAQPAPLACGHSPRSSGLAVAVKKAFTYGLLACAPVVAGNMFSPALASDSRALVLAIPAGLDDPSFLFAYPSTVAGLSLVVAEVGRPNSDAYGGALYTSGASTFGLFVSRDASLMQGWDASVSDSPDLVDAFIRPLLFSRIFMATQGPDPARPIDLVYAHSLGGRRSFGARLTWAGDHNETKTEAQTAENTSDQLDLQLSYSGKTSAVRYDLGMKAGLMGSIENSTKQNGATTRQTFSRGLSLEFNGRAIYAVSQQLEAFGKLGLFFESPEIEGKAGDTSQSEDLKEILFDLQAGALIKPQTGTFVALGAGLIYFSSEGPFSIAAAQNQTVPQSLQVGAEVLAAQVDEGTSKKSGYGMLATTGLETDLTESWVFLAGLGYPLFGSITAQDKVSDGDPKYELRFTDIPDAALWRFGVGYRHNDLKIDAGINAKSLLHSGPQFITGNSVANPMIFIISAVYDFSPAATTSTSSETTPPST